MDACEIPASVAWNTPGARSGSVGVPPGFFTPGEDARMQEQLEKTLDAAVAAYESAKVEFSALGPHWTATASEQGVWGRIRLRKW